VSVCPKGIPILVLWKRKAVPSSRMRILEKMDFSISSVIFTLILMGTPVPIPRHTPMNTLTGTATLMELLTLPYLLLTKGSGQ
jgi:hypothetical protein